MIECAGLPGCTRPTKHWAPCGTGERICGPCYSAWRRNGTFARRAPDRATPGSGLAFLVAAVDRDRLRSSSDPCTVWPFGLSEGYGTFQHPHKRPKRPAHAHRFALVLATGEPRDPSLEATHACGNSACVGVHHLRWGTHAENMADKIVHGTLSLGELHGNSILTDTAVLNMRSARASGRTFQSVDDEYGVSLRAAWKAIRGQTWHHLDSATVPSN